ncbi:hypothetical protein V8E51_017641 [Hyaloscypha variabilis]
MAYGGWALNAGCNYVVYFPRRPYFILALYLERKEKAGEILRVLDDRELVLAEEKQFSELNAKIEKNWKPPLHEFPMAELLRHFPAAAFFVHQDERFAGSGWSGIENLGKYEVDDHVGYLGYQRTPAKEMLTKARDDGSTFEVDVSAGCGDHVHVMCPEEALSKVQRAKGRIRRILLVSNTKFQTSTTLSSSDNPYCSGVSCVIGHEVVTRGSIEISQKISNSQNVFP